MYTRAAAVAAALLNAMRRRIVLLVALGCTLLLALQALLVFIAIDGTRSISAAYQRAVQNTMPAVSSAYQLKSALQNRIIFTLRMLEEVDPFEREGDAAAFAAQRPLIEAEIARLRALALEPHNEALLTDALQDAVRLSELQRPIVEALIAGADAQARALLQEQSLLGRQRAALSALQRFAHSQTASLNEALATTQAAAARAQRSALALGAVLFAIGIAVGITVTFATSRAAAAIEGDRRRAVMQAMTDPLTGLLNRRGLQRELARWCRGRRAAASRDCVLAIDLDGFKKINDAAGHAAGDALLQQVSAALTECMRPSDRIARVGGDEFVILLRDTDRTGAVAVAQRVRGCIGDCQVVLAGKALRVGASIGVATLDPGAGEEACERAIQAADAASYRAKREGGGRIAFAEDSASPMP